MVRALNFKGLSGLLVVGERKIFSEIAEILKIAIEANRIMAEMVKELNLETLAAENQSLSQLEKQADEATFRVRRHVIDGAVNPTALDNLLTCIDLADSVVDDYRYLARELTRMAQIEPQKNLNRLPSLDAAFLEMLSLGAQSFAKVQELLAENNAEDMARIRREIERLEERGDEIKDNGFDELYRLAPRLHYLDFVHYTEIIHKIDDILDACEDMSDLVVTIVTSMSK